MSFQMMPRELMKMIGDMTNYTLYMVWFRNDLGHDGLLSVFNNLNDAVDSLISYIGAEYKKPHIYKDGWIYNYGTDYSYVEHLRLYIEETPINSYIPQDGKLIDYQIVLDDSNNLKLVKFKGYIEQTYEEMLAKEDSFVYTDFNWTPTEKYMRFNWKFVLDRIKERQLRLNQVHGDYEN
jgi:hypothetical protein